MPVTSEKYNRVCVIGIDGDLSHDAGIDIRRLVDQSIAGDRIVDFVLDLERMPFIDSDGLGTLLWLKRRCEEAQGQVKIAGMKPNIRKILKITRLEHRFEYHDDLASALKAATA